MDRKILKSMVNLGDEQLRGLFDGFNSPLTSLDCGGKCSLHNPSGKPFCCDICHAVPAAYTSEWNYFRHQTDLWHEYRGNECGTGFSDGRVKEHLPNGMILLACLGPDRCQRNFRALSCRQFPFFPYVTSDYRFIGLANEWEFEDRCWVLSNLSLVTGKYREEFVRIHDHLFALFQDVFENYAYHSERMRAVYAGRGRRFVVMHRNGGYYLISPTNERMQKVDATALR